jgi:hypothetical protein
MTTACAGSSPTAPSTPTPPPQAACQVNNTADVAFANGTNLTLTVRWDGSIVGTLGPGQTSSSMTVPAGVMHRNEMIVANTGVAACTATPSLAQCSTNTLTCRP